MGVARDAYPIPELEEAMTKPKPKPDPNQQGVSVEELARLRRKAKQYLKDPKLEKLRKDLQEDVLVSTLIDKTMGQETWRSTDRVASDSRGRFIKQAEAIEKDIEKRVGDDDDDMDGILGGDDG